MKVIDIDGKEIETLKLDKKPGVLEQTPIEPEKTIESDPTIHDGPDDDVRKPKLPEQVPETNPETKPEAKSETKPETKSETKPAQTAPPLTGR